MVALLSPRHVGLFLVFLQLCSSQLTDTNEIGSGPEVSDSGDVVSDKTLNVLDSLFSGDENSTSVVQSSEDDSTLENRDAPTGMSPQPTTPQDEDKLPSSQSEMSSGESEVSSSESEVSSSESEMSSIVSEEPRIVIDQDVIEQGSNGSSEVTEDSGSMATTIIDQSTPTAPGITSEVTESSPTGVSSSPADVIRTTTFPTTDNSDFTTKPPTSSESKKTQVILVLVGIFFVLVSIVASVVLCFFKRRRSRQHVFEETREQNGAKIIPIV